MRFTVDKQRLEAERMIIEANATAQSNFIKSKSITPELISWEFRSSFERKIRLYLRNRSEEYQQYFPCLKLQSRVYPYYFR